MGESVYTGYTQQYVNIVKSDGGPLRVLWRGTAATDGTDVRMLMAAVPVYDVRYNSFTLSRVRTLLHS